MAVYKLFPTQDTTLYSFWPKMNTGLDPIIEASTTSFAPNDPFPHSTRILMKFSQEEIEDILTNKVGSKEWGAEFKLFLAEASGLSQTSTMLCNPIQGNWVNGTGQYLDSPQSTDGASWRYIDSLTTQWPTSSFSPYVTASYSGSYTIGGGTWYTGSANQNHPNVEVSQSFTLYSSKDLNFNVTSTIHNWLSSSIDNDGFIVRQSPVDEFRYSFDQQSEVKYFSVDTNTIFPPLLEIKWDDYLFSTGSSNMGIVDNQNIYTSIQDNKGEFHPESVNKFRVNVRDKFPQRTYQTSSLYLNGYYLPEGSTYAIQDVYTNEYVVDYDEVYTKISADETSSYFNLFMNGLQPERWYKILIKTTINDSILVLDDKYQFKVING